MAPTGRVIVFDLNGTLLNTQALAPQLSKVFGSSYSVREWFSETILNAEAITLAGDYREFRDIAIAVLRMAAQARGKSVPNNLIEDIWAGLRQTPPFPDVERSLARLRGANFRLATLTNSSPESMGQQLGNAGIAEYFEMTMSVQAVRRFKPAPETYRRMAYQLGVGVQEILMIAAHPWDLLGASRAGCRTAFLARPGKALLPGAPPPDYTARNLDDLTDQLLGNRAEPSRHDENGPGFMAAMAAVFAAAGLLSAVLLLPRLRSTAAGRDYS